MNELKLVKAVPQVWVVRQCPGFCLPIADKRLEWSDHPCVYNRGLTNTRPLFTEHATAAVRGQGPGEISFGRTGETIN